MPDFKWLNDVLPDTEQYNKYSNNLKELRDKISGSIDIGKPLLTFHYSETLSKLSDFVGISIICLHFLIFSLISWLCVLFFLSPLIFSHLP